MKRSINLFLTISLCIGANVSIAMEVDLRKDKQAKILTKITCIKDPFNAYYLTDNRILIDGRDRCSIIDPTTNKEIKRIFDRSEIAVHPNKTKFALSAYHYPPNSTDMDDAQQKITIHNAQTYDIEHTIDWDTIDGTTIEKMLFSPLDDTLAVGGNCNIKVILYNYTTKNITHINVPEARSEHYEYNAPRDPIVAFHPTQPFMCLAWKTVYLHDLTTSTNSPITRIPHYHTFCEYSPNGSFFVTGTDFTINCNKPGQLPHLQLIAQQYAEHTSDSFCGMAIHPNGKVLMTLSRKPYDKSDNFDILQYWDIETSQCITTAKLPLSEYDVRNSHTAFSPCGTKLLIIMNNTLMELKVRFKVLYHNLIKKQFLYLLFALKNYTHDDIAIPHELAQLIATTVHKTYKR